MEDKTWKKLDKKLFRFINNIILFGVNRSKYKKHKYQIYKYLLYGQIVTFFSMFFMLIVSVMSGNNSYVFIGLITASYLLFLLFIGKDILSADKLIGVYTPIFKLRKNPAIYNNIKEFCKKHFNLYIYRRKRLFILSMFILSWGSLQIFLFILTRDLFFIFTAIFFYYWFFCSILGTYVHCVFDFDKPKRKIRKKAGELTDRQKQSWLDLISLPKLNPDST